MLNGKIGMLVCKDHKIHKAGQLVLHWLNRFLNVKVLVGAFNKEKALSVNVNSSRRTFVSSSDSRATQSLGQLEHLYHCGAVTGAGYSQYQQKQ